ncbi:Fic family protein [Flavobacterium franklandianum]|uniref:Fic family protein n=1 Tax=Flavobacterium franklandianum TaxID=2594430 RepID=A0A553CIY3_9FLAO|nr:Fic family protein [Flavobacterium franklandianum]TRX20440.1 Fic family protein [Flavobacterium franklandianum]TRX25123.1 Fic family protein [Flavobacterium franklandianum]
MKLLKIKEKYFSLIEADDFDYPKFNQFAIVHHSNSIEGSTLTKEETYLLLEEHLTPKNKPLEHTLMAVDHLAALKFVVTLAEEKTPLTIEIIKELSALVMKTTGSEISSMAGNFDSSKGDFRKVTVRAGTTTFMDYKKVPERVSELVDYINKTIAKSEDFIEINNLAFDVHFQLVSIHPFADGNGRISRLLMNYIQQYHKLPLSVVYKEDKQDYFNALQETRKKEDIIIFRKFMFTQTEKFLTEQIEELTKKQTSKKTGKGFSFLF